MQVIPQSSICPTIRSYIDWVGVNRTVWSDSHNTQMMLSQGAFLGSFTLDGISFILFYSLLSPKIQLFFTKYVLPAKFSDESIMF